MSNPNRGTLHKATPETVNHLSIHCPFPTAFSDVYLSRFIIAYFPGEHGGTFPIMAIEGVDKKSKWCDMILGAVYWVDLGEY